MNMQIKLIENKQEWEEFVSQQPYTLFVQSCHYGEFYEAMGEQSWIFGIYEKGELIGGSLVVSVHAKRGSFLYLPYGPILPLDKKSESLAEFTVFLKQFARKSKYDFIRVSPFLNDDEQNRGAFKSAGFRPAPMHILAETTWLLDLAPAYHDLLMNMNKNHRNLLHRCERGGVRVEKFNYASALNDFNKLHDLTSRRHKFHRFSDEYVTKEFNAFAPYEQALVLHGYLPDSSLDSSAIIIYYGNMAAYRHGASLNLDKKIPTSYLLQWEAIREAKKRGLRWYNFWGIAPDNAPTNHPFNGITHFKKGFGGAQKNLLHCQDLPINKKYWINWLVETFRREKRGF